MTRAILAFGGVAALMALGIGWNFGLFRGPTNFPRAPESISTKPAAASEHLSPDRLLTVTMEQLHAEALQRFYADPRNGMYRMPTVYERVVKQWPEIWWSSGDLEMPEVAKPGKELEQIHSRSIDAFLAPKPIAPAVPYLFINSDLGYKEKPRNWEAKNVDLVGLLKHAKPIVYMSESLPDMKILRDLPTRDLDDFERVGLKHLADGEALFSRSRDGVTRLLGAVRAKADCLSCHDGKSEGDLLGAFSYTLREAVYERRSQFSSRP